MKANPDFNKKRHLVIRIWLVVFCLLFAIPIGTFATSLDELEARREELERQNDQLRETIATLENDEQLAQERQEAVSAQIDVVQNQIDNTIANIAAHDAEILELTEKIMASQENIEDTFEQLRVRIKALYKSGDVGTLEILLNSESLHDFSLRSEMLKSVTKHDKMLIDIISAFMNETQEEREQVEQKKAALAELKKELDEKNEELNDLKEENAILINELQLEQEDAWDAIVRNEEEGANVIAQIEAEIAARAAREKEEREAAQRAWEQEQARLEAEAEAERQKQLEAGVPEEEIDNTIPENTAPPAFNDGFNPTWPLPGGSITHHYGNGHNGLDIAGSYGSAIVAAEAGEVIVANNYDSWGDSWGYYVLIYHNSRYTTRYAHCSSISVVKGQYVQKGQVIATQGNTGYSFGDHLHFEVYQDGWRVNPYQFF